MLAVGFLSFRRKPESSFVQLDAEQDAEFDNGMRTGATARALAFNTPPERLVS